MNRHNIIIASHRIVESTPFTIYDHLTTFLVDWGSLELGNIRFENRGQNITIEFPN